MQGNWISIKEIKTHSPQSPTPLLFRRSIENDGTVERAVISATAMGIYEIRLNGQKVGDRYFAPGFTSYEHVLQYDVYDLRLNPGHNTLSVVVGGGWAVGRSTFIQDTTQSFSQIAADSPALLCEILIDYSDGRRKRIFSDTDWEVTDQSAYRFGDWYDGEIYDAGLTEGENDYSDIKWEQAAIFTPKVDPKIVPAYGEKVTAHETFTARFDHVDEATGELIYDFGQNFAGIVHFTVAGEAGRQITIRHAEALQADGSLYVQNLRSAKAQIVYICRDGLQEYQPTLTYMGFRYIGVSGISAEHIIALTGIALYSDMKEIGSFECSNETINRLQQNILWSTKSNFVDIPTDCPQRDERQGWTGDIALFADTACFNFDTEKFLNKWLRDLRSEQGENGEIPFVIPRRGYEQTPSMLTSTWGDSCILVPWAVYRSTGDTTVLKENYATMDRYMNGVKACAAMTSGAYPDERIWDFPFHFGDWCAPYGHPGMWLAKGPWVGTACWAYSCGIMAEICEILAADPQGTDAVTGAAAWKEKENEYRKLRQEISDAFFKTFTGEDSRLNEEFQTGYVLPIYFKLGTEEQRRQMTDHLVRLLEENSWHSNTGFQSTPFILFALADNGHADAAYRILMQESAPSWLYQVKMGATTTWEQWDSVQEDGSIKESSLNHYAYGAVGDYLYRRVAGLEPIEAGYRTFAVKPVPGGGLTWAKCRHMSRCGLIEVEWHAENGFEVDVTVPEQTECMLTLPDGRKEVLGPGRHHVK